MGAAEADQLCRSILGHEMSRLHLDGILTQPHLRRRRRVARASLPMTAVEIVTAVVNRDDRSLLEATRGSAGMISESPRVYPDVTSSNIH